MPHLPHPIKHHHEKKANDKPNLDSKDSSNDIEKINTDYKGKLDEVAIKARGQHNENSSGDDSGSGSYTNAAIETGEYGTWQTVVPHNSHARAL